MTKKKYLLVLLALILTLSMAACGGSDSDKEKDKDTSAESGSSNETAQVAETLIDWMKSETFSFDYILIAEFGGEKMEGDGSMVMKKGNYENTMSYKSKGVEVKTRVIVKDGKAYIIDDANKMLVKMSTLDPATTSGMPTEYSDMKKTDSGKEDVNGKNLPYDEYTIEGISVKYYTDGGQIYAIKTGMEDGSATMIIKNASKTIPDGAFNIPDGYQEMSV